jgi:uncharacterized protein (DUF1697 family)
MAVIISLLRGVNLAGHKPVKMDALRKLHESLGLRDVQTYINSGNVIFKSEARALDPVRRRIEKAIERTFGFHADVMLRTCSELREIIARNPFATRRGIDPRKLAVSFLAAEPGAEARKNVLKIKADPEELRITGRELYIYFANGMARPKLSVAQLEKTLKTSGTNRNWNTVTKLLELAEKMEGAGDTSVLRPAAAAAWQSQTG